MLVGPNQRGETRYVNAVKPVMFLSLFGGRNERWSAVIVDGEAQRPLLRSVK